MYKKRLNSYFIETQKHIELIEESLDVLEKKVPIKDYGSLNQLERFALNALIFRFSKLQDLIGAKIFRNYLEYSGFNTTEKSFFDILKEIEKEGIIDIDSWNELRVLRNKIAHDYPEDADEVIESINLFISRVEVVISIAKKLEQKFYEIRKKRNGDS